MHSTIPQPDADGQSRAYAHIRAGILHGSYRSGQRLRAQEIAAAIDLSRTPVREALSRLAHDGFVDKDSAGGFSVRTMTPADIQDLFQVREVLELEAARLALPRIDAQWLALTGTYLDEAQALLDAGQPAAALMAARRLYIAVAQRSGNGLLLKMLESINDQVHIVGASLITRMPERAQEVMAENRSVLDALRAGDADRLARDLRAHIRRSRDLIFSHH